MGRTIDHRHSAAAIDGGPGVRAVDLVVDAVVEQPAGPVSDRNRVHDTAVREVDHLNPVHEIHRHVEQAARRIQADAAGAVVEKRRLVDDRVGSAVDLLGDRAHVADVRHVQGIVVRGVAHHRSFRDCELAANRVAGTVDDGEQRVVARGEVELVIDRIVAERAEGSAAGWNRVHRLVRRTVNHGHGLVAVGGIDFVADGAAAEAVWPGRMSGRHRGDE